MRALSYVLLLMMSNCSDPSGSTDRVAGDPNADPGLTLGALDDAARTIPYAGYVDFDGQPVNAGQVAFNFALFPCATPGTGGGCSAIWVAKGAWTDTADWTTGWPSGPTDKVDLPIFGGRFTAELGASGQNPLPDEVFRLDHDALYLGVRIQGRPLGSLQRIVPAARARVAQNGVPPGTVSYFAAGSAPVGWLPCDGGAISRATYAELFAVIGTSYGAGDGATTFNLPNGIDRLALGSEAVGNAAGAWSTTTSHEGEHHHRAPMRLTSYVPALGSPYVVIDDELNPETVAETSNGRVMITPGFNAVGVTDPALQATSTRLGTSKAGDHAHSVEVRPPTLTLLPIIKY